MSKQDETKETKLTRVTAGAYDSLPVLRELIAEEKGLSDISNVEAVSIAIKETMIQAMKRRVRRQQRQDELATRK